MKGLSLNQGLRFVFAGMIFYVYLFLVFPQHAATFAASVGVIGFPLGVTVVGSCIYFLYRPLVYDLIIDRIQARWNPFGPGYRQELMKRYGITCDQATYVFVQVRDKHLRDRYEHLSVQAAGIHMTYQAGILALIMAGVGAWQGQVGPTWVLLVVAVMGLVGGYLNDSRYERIERDMLMTVDREAVDKIVDQLGYARSTSCEGV